jgi:capsular exopolysaccharide synthesis family protein
MLPMESSPSLQATAPAAATNGNGTVASVHSAHAAIDSAPPPGLSAPPTVDNLWQALRRRWVFILSVSLVGAALAAGIGWLAAPGNYTASTLLRLSARGMHIPEGENEAPAFQKTQAALLKSPALIATFLAQPEVKDLVEVRAHSDPAAWLQKEIVTETTLGPELLRVNLSGDHPADIAQMLNKLIKLYLTDLYGKEEAKINAHIKQLDEGYAGKADLLNKKRVALQAREALLGIDDLQTIMLKQQTYVSQLQALQNQRLALQLKRQQLVADRTAQQALIDKPDSILIPAFNIDRELRTDPLVSRQLERVIELNKEIQIAQTKLSGELRLAKIQAAEGEKSEILSGLEKHREVIREGLRSKTVAELKESNVKLDAQIKLGDEQDEVLGANITKTQADLIKLKTGGQVPADVQKMRDEVTQLEGIVRKIGEDVANLEAEKAGAARVEQIEQARPPESKRLDRKAKVAGMTGAGVFVLCFLGLTMLEFRQRRVHSAEEVQRGLGLKLLGTLPLLPVQTRRVMANGTTATLTPEEGALLESVDSLRTVLLHTSRSGPLHTIMVTSPGVGEGKTSLACQLAGSLARTGRKTLLLDADLRHPAAHSQFGLPLAPGFCELLRGDADLDQVIQKTPLDHLLVLPAGTCDREAVESLTRPEVADLFKWLKDRFDYIVIDTSPILPVADALLIGQHADAVLFSVLSNVSRLPAIYAAQQKLAGLGIRILGAVVTGPDAESYGAAPYKRQLLN